MIRSSLDLSKPSSHFPGSLRLPRRPTTVCRAATWASCLPNHK